MVFCIWAFLNIGQDVRLFLVKGQSLLLLEQSMDFALGDGS